MGALVHRAIERGDINRRVLDVFDQLSFDATDFALPGQKDQHRAVIGPQRFEDRIDDLIVDTAVRVAPDIARLNRKGAAFAGDHGRIIEQARDACAIQGCGHHDDPQIIAKRTLGVERKCQA